MATFGSATPGRITWPAVGGTFPKTGTAYTATGVSIPFGSLDRWFAARNRSDKQLVEVICKGDSTFAGQVVGLDPPTDHYSPVTRLRARLIADGYTDGGHGLNNGANDTPSVSGDPVSGVSSQTGFGNTDSFQLPSEVRSSSAVSDTITFSGYGTHIRVFYRTSVIGGLFTYSVDGGSAVTVDGSVNPVGSTYNFAWIDVPGLTDGLHTVTVVNTSGADCLVLCDFQRTTGIVLHNHSVRGGALSNTLTSAQHLELELGLVRSATETDASLRPLDTASGVRRPVLIIQALGINNQQGAGGVDTSADVLADTILQGNAARAAGADFLIVIPALETANQSQLSPNYRAALKSAAATLNAPWVDIGMGGAMPSLTAGSTGNNPHLSASQYQTQADFIWDQVLGVR